jgi:hypothetical protein
MRASYFLGLTTLGVFNSVAVGIGAFFSGAFAVLSHSGPAEPTRRRGCS